MTPDEPVSPDLDDQPPRASEEKGEASGADLSENLALILDIDLPLAVRLGATEMTLEELMRLSPGSVIDLRRAPDESAEVLVNGKLVARGDVVVVDGNYGVRITDIVSQAKGMS